MLGPLPLVEACECRQAYLRSSCSASIQGMRSGWRLIGQEFGAHVGGCCRLAPCFLDSVHCGADQFHIGSRDPERRILQAHAHPASQCNYGWYERKDIDCESGDHPW